MIIDMRTLASPVCSFFIEYRMKVIFICEFYQRKGSAIHLFLRHQKVKTHRSFAIRRRGNIEPEWILSSFKF